MFDDIAQSLPDGIPFDGCDCVAIEDSMLELFFPPSVCFSSFSYFFEFFLISCSSFLLSCSFSSLF